ncbi:TIR domain-containing protein [Pseudomonas sp. 3-2]|uniref:TIR domain-containing protein n=1 Tax=Pseudomonas sp. 3-2 TaxID=2867408 RepID=UPI001C874365|nr:TIR domain-containing protein [Pseudomonas sp. 3-2]QZD69430.1 TIR domain-containing protein [Pseudomonas sp. 3-2]
MRSPVKVFVSYSHEDESYRNDLVKYFSNMVRNKEISTWTDRDISASQKWREEIDNNLNGTQVIIFLVSPDFINSDYCVDVEMARALEMHRENQALIVPIYIRATDVKHSPLAEIHSLPTDRRPIKSWDDKDRAWLDVIEGLRKTIATLPEEKEMATVVDLTLKLTESHRSWLDDTEIALVHRLVPKVKLSDVYVPPDFTLKSGDFSNVRKVVGYRKIFEDLEGIIVIGEEQAGKTSLAKFIIREGLAEGFFPVYISGKDVVSAAVDKLIARRISEQYSESLGGFEKSGKKPLLLLDDFHLITLNKKYIAQLVDHIKSVFAKVVIFAKDTFRYVLPDHASLESFQIMSIHDFGNVKRTQLIEKWVALGREEHIDEAELFKESDEIKVRVDSIIRKNVVPSKPIFIISVLQMLEAYTSQRLELTSHGHCYQSLVYQALEKINVKSNEIDKYINVLSELAWKQYSNDGEPLSSRGLVEFFEDYERQFLSVDRVKVTQDLINCHLLRDVDGKVSFKYPYIYYFFAAKKIADTFSKDIEIKKEITRLLDGLHREDHANIIIFITHHTKDAWILDEIQMSLMALFSDNRLATLQAEDLSFLDEFLKEIPKLVMVEREVQQERLKRDEALDEMQLYDQQDLSGGEYEPVVLTEGDTNLFANVNKVFKGSELIGQIIRNRHASLNREEMTHLLRETYGCGLRFLQFFIELSDMAKESVVHTISHEMRENPLQTNLAIEKEAKSTFLSMTFVAIYAVLKKMATSTGCAEAEEIYKSLEDEISSPAIKIINQAITLDFHKRIDFKALSALADEFKSNAVCDRILKEIVIQHVYMFPVNYRDKQKISSYLNVPMERLQLQDVNKNVKMLEAK